MIDRNVSTILDSLGAAVFVIGRNRTILTMNQAARERFSDAAVGQDFVRTIRHPDCLRAIDEVFAGATSAKTEIALTSAPPTSFKVSVCRLDYDPPQRARAAVCLEDVSRIRDAELMRSEFVANVSHELRSPLTTLAGFVETLKGPAKDDPEAQARFLDFMDREARRMTRLIGDLLSLSKYEDKVRIRPSGQVDVVATIERVIATLNVEARREHKVLRLVRPSATKLIPGDEDEITQVFQNLIENAIKYGGLDTEIVTTVQLRPKAPGVRGTAVVVDVRDEGPGIAAEDIPRLTERFYRVDKSRSRDKGGTGLGLAIVKHILNRHRGRLQIESQEGVGSTFTVILPVDAES